MELAASSSSRSMESTDSWRVRLVFHPVPKSREPPPPRNSSIFARSGAARHLPGAGAATSALLFEAFKRRLGSASVYTRFQNPPGLLRARRRRVEMAGRRGPGGSPLQESPAAEEGRRRRRRRRRGAPL
jgi:hypothetical protein